MPRPRPLWQTVTALALAAALGCGRVAVRPLAGDELPPRRIAAFALETSAAGTSGSARAALTSAAEALLAAGEDQWMGPPPVETSPAEIEVGRVTLLVAGGIGLPRDASVGSAPGTALPSYSQMWTPGTALDVAAVFKPNGKARPFARLSWTQLYGKVWQDPSNPYDVWRASDASIISLSGGVRFGGGKEGKPYGKVGLGLVMLPETSRLDTLTGASTPILESSAGVGLALGAGVEMSLANLEGFVDLDYHIGPSPSAASEAGSVWPGFAAGDGLNLVTITGGLRISF